MSLLVIMVLALVVAALVSALIVVGMKASKLGEALELSAHKVNALEGERREWVDKLAAVEQEKEKLATTLQERPETKRQTYRILTLGVTGSGKTSLTLKWANPLADTSSVSGMKMARYERSVSRVQTANEITEHVFAVHDCGGEQMVDAVQALSTEDVQGLLIVVDLGSKDAKIIDHERIQAQLQEFQPQALRYFFVPKMIASCKTVVLFINKSDLIPGAPAQIEDQAKQLYQPLIDSLTKYAGHMDVKVFVGSANYGHSTHLLFSHLVEKILPKEAYDQQLLQQLETKPSPASAIPIFTAPPLPPVESSTQAPSLLQQKPSPRLNTLRGPLPFLHKSNGIAKHVD